MFGPTAARSLPGPDWLRARRGAAVDRLDGAHLPSVDEEVWRYSRIGELDLDRYEPLAEAPSHTAPDALDQIRRAVPDAAALVVVRDGFVVHHELQDRWAERGVHVGPLAEAAQAEQLASTMDDGRGDVFDTMNAAYSAEPVLVHVPAGVAVDAPILLVDWLSIAGVAVFPRTIVHVGEAGEATVVEYLAGDDVAAFAAPRTEIEVGPSGRLSLATVQRRSAGTWQIAEQTARVGQQATFVGHQVALGGDYARSRIDCRLVGRGATGNLRAAYFGAGEQMLDFRTFQDHLAPDTTSDLLFKGAVAGTSRSVYTGLIHVAKEARGTNAFQTNRNVKLSDGAWAESVPNLEIENNDVHCSHASTVGPIDEDQRFYLESRGVPPRAAERLILSGFFGEVLAELPVATLTAHLSDEIDDRLTTEVGR
jgi:Fe-S cluster assembly protein SufD